jgi:hypothetical protein
MTRALSRSVSPEPQQDAGIEDSVAQEEEYQRRRMEEEYRRIQEIAPVRETFEDESGPSGTQQEEEKTTPDPKGKGKMVKVTPKTRTKK